MKALKALMFLFMFMLPVALFANGDLPDVPGSLTPADYFADFLTWIATVVFLTSAINKLPFLNYEDNQKRYLSWGVMVVTGLVAFLFNWGIFDTEWYFMLVYIVGGAIGSHIGYHAVKAFITDVIGKLLRR